jgi:metal-responsive CopG/Arc/MetJ family transcriptional regulator
MKVVQMTLDESLVREIDKMVRTLKTSRSEFTRNALRMALRMRRRADQERRHRKGYEVRPVTPEEFADWEAEQVWGD